MMDVSMPSLMSWKTDPVVLEHTWDDVGGVVPGVLEHDGLGLPVHQARHRHVHHPARPLDSDSQWKASRRIGTIAQTCGKRRPPITITALDRPVNPIAIVLVLVAVSAVTMATATIAAPNPPVPVSVDDFNAGVFTDSKGTTLRYRLFEPRGYDPAGADRYPLVTFLHGNGDQGSDNRRQVREGARVWAEPANQKLHPAFVVAPQCPAEDGWGVRRASPATLPAPRSTRSSSCSTISSGASRSIPIGATSPACRAAGWGTLRALSHQPERFAAAILVCPAGEPAKNPEVPARENGVGVVAGIEKLPLWFFHGTDDPIVPISLTRDRVAALRQAGGDPRLTEYPGVKHDAWVKAYAEPAIVDWLFAQRRSR